MAALSWAWATLAPNATLNFYAWGLDNNEAATFSLIVFAGSGRGVPFPGARATLNQGEHFRDNNGTWGRKLVIKNNAPFNSINVHIVAQVDRI